jgi:uncharacterized protein YbbK (DUF523 family)
MKPRKFLISACLVGIKCRFDGKDREDKKMKKLMEKGEGLAVCPETLGGLILPRPEAEITWGRGENVLSGKSNVIDRNKKNVTPQMVRGAIRTFKIARRLKIRTAFMKEKSPSCGSEKIYRKGKIVQGEGVTAALLQKKGIKVIPR